MTRTTKRNSNPKQSGLQELADIVTQIQPQWNAILKRFNKLGHIYGFQRIDTPIVEEVSLYDRYYGDRASQYLAVVAEIGNKPMAIRPSFLPSILRAYGQYKVAEENQISKWLYSGNVVHLDSLGAPVSDYEFGLEVLGSFTHLTEAQAISAVWQLVQGLGLQEAVLEINTIGDVSCQAAYQDVLRDYLRPKKFELCDNCNEALSNRTLDVLRCNNLECQVVVSEAPPILDFLDDPTQKHFTNILEALDEVQVPYQLSPTFAGPAHTSRTSLVIKYKHDGRTIILAEGSYHDGLAKNVTGKSVCSFGLTGSLSAIQQAMAASEIAVQQESRSEVYLVPLGELASKRSLRLFHDLTTADVRVYDHFGSVGVKNQLKQAEESKSPIALIMGQKEAMEEMVILRDVKSGMQEVFSYDKIVTEVKKRLGR